MKKIIVLMVIASFLCAIGAAQEPVSWSYSAKKTGNGSYEVHVKAKIAAPWHLYSQYTPDGGPVKTQISFTKNPLLVINGQPEEMGSLIQKHEEVFGIDVKYFNGSVDFVQPVLLRQKGRKVKTKLTGTVEYMACNDTQCLPPKKMRFEIAIQ